MTASEPTATTINFIAYFDDPSHARWVNDATTKLAEKHHSRAIVVDATLEGEHTTSPFALEARGLSPERLRERVATALAPDLPTVLWWTDDAMSANPAFEALVDLTDALVINTSGNERDEAMVVELAAFVEARPTVSVRDIAWMRLRPWQDMIAQSFDDASLREELFSIRGVRIVAGSDAEALYLGGWLASRLGWTACARNEFCDRTGVHIPFHAIREGKARRICSVEVQTISSTYSATVSADDDDVLILSSHGPIERPKRTVQLAAIDNATLLERAILEPATDEIFEAALRMVAALVR